MKHCPECRGEDRNRVSRCVDCDAELLAGPPPAADPGERPDAERVTVYATANPALVALVKSLFEEAGIAYFTKGDIVQDLIGWGRLAGPNIATGPAEFVVASDAAPLAHELVSQIEDATPEGLPEDEPDR